MKRLIAIPILLTLILLAVSATTASADFTFGSVGSGAGQFQQPAGIAVDRTDGRVYVSDAGNHRIDVFKTDGAFLEAFGWSVADGQSAELQTCTATCFVGLEGGGAGEFGDKAPGAIAVDNDPSSPSFHDIYVVDGVRIQKFSPDGEFLLTWGGGVITGGASGTGTVAAGSTEVENVKTTRKGFANGQSISGAGIPADTKIVGIGPGSITLSRPATASGTGVALSVAEGAGNVPVNEIQVLTFPDVPIFSSEETFQLSFSTGDPSPTREVTPPLLYNASPGQVQAALAALPNVGPGNVSVTSPNAGGVQGVPGGPYSIEFKGTRFADTDVNQLTLPGSSPRNKTIVTARNGASAAELCTAAVAVSCSAGVQGNGEPGQLSSGHEGGGPIAVGPGGTVYVAVSKAIAHPGSASTFESHIESFAPSGVYLGSAGLPDSEHVLVGLAVDTSGHLFTTEDGGDSGVRRLEWGEPSALEFAPPLDPGIASGPLSVDESDNLFAWGADSAFNPIAEYDASGATIRRFGYEAQAVSVTGLAAYHSAAGDIFTASSRGSQASLSYLSVPPSGPFVTPPKASPVGNAKATLRAQINPEGVATSYHFDYIDDNGFEQGGFAGPGVKSSPVEQLGPTDFRLHEVQVQVGCPDAVQELPEGKCLTPEDTYHFRVVVEDAEGHDAEEVGAPFTTKPPGEIHATWAARVGTGSALLEAEANPLGIPTTGYFEYVTDAQYLESGFSEASTAPDVTGGQAPIDFGSGESQATRSAVLDSLSSATTYHYRLTITDPLIDHPIVGPDNSLTTLVPPSAPNTDCPNQAFRTGASAALPDCRAYEMVSPVDKNGGDAGLVGHGGTISTQASSSGDKVAYSSVTPFGDPAGAALQSQYIATRAPDGWSTSPISPSRGLPLTHGGFLLAAAGYGAFSDDLCEGWLLSGAADPLGAGAPPGFINIYRHNLCDGSGYLPLNQVTPPHQPSGVFLPEFQASSADGSRAIFMATDKLSPEANDSGTLEQLYEWHEGRVQAVCVLPGGSKVSGEDCMAGWGETFKTPVAGQRESNRAMSEDGSRIFFTTFKANTNPVVPGKLYVRIGGSETLPVSGSVSNAAARFWTASVTGSKAIFTIGGNVEDVGAIGSDLYEFSVESKAKKKIAGEVLGVVGASEDASLVYFVSREAKAGAAEAGGQNLYLYDSKGDGGAGSYAFVGKLTAQDALANGSLSVDNLKPTKRVSRVTPDGRHLAFMSSEALTGQENADVETGIPDANVYLYSADSGHLTCASCNPTRARPSGRLLFEVSPTEKISAAARIPVWDTQLYAQRVLSDDGGRLFFESFEPLVAADTNGRQDVYEWEAQGKGDCEEEEGCVRLISSGQSQVDSSFLDASPDGSDVFVATTASLVPIDPGSLDVYDARIGGGFAYPVQAPGCEGEACQGPLEAPNDPTPASAAFEGAGNLKQAVPPRPRCLKGRHLVKKGGKARCAPSHRKRGSHRKSGTGSRQHKRHSDRRAER